MRAELKASGNVVLRADNEVEAYALGCWIKEQRVRVKEGREAQVYIDVPVNGVVKVD